MSTKNFVSVRLMKEKNVIEEVNKKIPRVAEIDREIFQCGMENTKRIFKNPDKADEYNRDFKENLRKTRK